MTYWSADPDVTEVSAAAASAPAACAPALSKCSARMRSDTCSRPHGPTPVNFLFSA
jgi:hypothetical protein